MKKIFKFLVCVLAILIAVPCGLGLFSKNITSAESSSQNSLEFDEFKSKVNNILIDFSAFNERVAGTDGEYQASRYITNYLSTNTAFTPRSNSQINDGIQKFRFLSDFSNIYETSQNIIYEFKVNSNNKKIILACNYDAFALALNEETYTYEAVGVEGINDSAGSVALILALASEIENLNLSVNVEVIFFGAGDSSNAGSSYYVQGLDKKERESILCMINFDNIALGENLYFYVDEVENDFSKFVSKQSSKNKLGLSQIETSHLNKVSLGSPNELGLNYTHLALASDNYHFMKLGILSMNIFAGNYESGVAIGRSEYSHTESITYTVNDKLEYIFENYDADTVQKNLFKVYNSVCLIITSENFVSALEASYGQNKLFYLIFGNEKLGIYLTVVAFGVMVCVAIVIHFKLTKRSYYSNIEIEFLSSVMKITEHIDETGADENVTKIVSQAIAQDIKKDKTIRGKKNKNKK